MLPFKGTFYLIFIALTRALQKYNSIVGFVGNLG